MSEEIKSGLISQIQPVVESMAANPKGAMMVATATAGAGIDTMFLKTLPLYLGLVATLLGIILTGVLIYRNIVLTIREDREYKRKIRERDIAKKEKL